MATGKLKWWSNDKGYGFITPDIRGKDIFLHVSELEKADLRELLEDGPLSYDISEHRGKKTAVNVKRLDEQAKK